MITTQHKDLAHWTVAHALSCGAQQVKLQLYVGGNVCIDMNNGEMERLQQASESALLLTLYVDGRCGFYSTNRLNRQELEKFISEGVEATRFLGVDEYCVLPDPSRYYRGEMSGLQTFDETIHKLQPDEKVAMARAAAEEVLGKDSRIVSVDTSYEDGYSESYMLISNGFEGESRFTTFSLSASVAVRGMGEARPSEYWFDSALQFDLLNKTGCGTKALERVLRKLDQQKVASGNYTMVVDALNSRRLLTPMLGALSGQALYRKNSFLSDSLGKPVGSPLMNLRDEPHTKGSFGARYFDNEGVATYAHPLFEEGVLRTFYIDTCYAGKLKMQPTVSSPSVLVMKPGQQSLDQLVADVERGILVTGFNGGNCSGTTGDFSYGIEGFLIEQGKLKQPVHEMNITGQMATLWQSLVAVGNDPRPFSSMRIPSLVFDQVMFSGC